MMIRGGNGPRGPAVTIRPGPNRRRVLAGLGGLLAGGGPLMAACARPSFPGLTPSGGINVSGHRQVVENLDITSDRDGIVVDGFDDVLIRSCRIVHAANGGSGAGILARASRRLRIEDCEIINAGAPDRGPTTSPQEISIGLDGCTDAEIARVTLRQGSSGIYASGVHNLTIAFLEAHDMRGPMPRGQAVQFDKCTGRVTLSDWSYESVPGTSKDEDNVNVYSTPNVVIANGRIPFLTDSPSGKGLLVEPGDGVGSAGARISNVELEYAFNGFVGVVGTQDVWVDVRVRYLNPYSVHGAASSDTRTGPLMFGFESEPAVANKLVAAYHDVNLENLIYEDDWVDEALVSEEWEARVPLIRNVFPWRPTGEVPVENLPPRIARISARSSTGDLLCLLPGRYDHDPTHRSWQWYIDGKAVEGETGFALSLAGIRPGASVMLGETPHNGTGEGLESRTAPLVV